MHGQNRKKKGTRGSSRPFSVLRRTKVLAQCESALHRKNGHLLQEVNKGLPTAESKTRCSPFIPRAFPVLRRPDGGGQRGNLLGSQTAHLGVQEDHGQEELVAAPDCSCELAKYGQPGGLVLFYQDRVRLLDCVGLAQHLDKRGRAKRLRVQYSQPGGLLFFYQEGMIALASHRAQKKGAGPSFESSVVAAAAHSGRREGFEVLRKRRVRVPGGVVLLSANWCVPYQL